jgi:type II secretory pathway component PulK
VAKLKKTIKRRVLWPMVSAGAAWVAGIAADRVLQTGLRRAGKYGRGNSLARSAATAALAGTAELLAVRGTHYALARVLGKKHKKH